jgi:hypothetical protein
VNLLWADGKVVLVEPYADLRVGKFVQLRAASRYFDVPSYQFRLGFPSRFKKSKQVIVKSLTFEPASRGKEGCESVLFASKVSDDDLSPSSPWMVQEYVKADSDITVAVVRDELFAFELDRHEFPDGVVDWRELPSESTTNNWQLHRLPVQIEKGLFQLMDDLELHFARIDFLLSKGRYYFLELNPNGHWAWLDAEDRHGLLDKVSREISPNTERHSIPFRSTSSWKYVKPFF